MEVAAVTVSVIALFLTFVGWFVNSWLTTRTQKQALINSLTNDARITLTDAIRDFQDWCAEIQSLTWSMPLDGITSIRQTNEQHERTNRELRELIVDMRSFLWLRRLEEYEPLFPDTASVRVELLNRVEAANDTAWELEDQHASGSSLPENVIERFREQIMDLLALTWDLLVFVQNNSIGRITGNEIPSRQPLDPNSIRLIADQSGRLIVRSPKQEEA